MADQTYTQTSPLTLLLDTVKENPPGWLQDSLDPSKPPNAEGQTAFTKTDFVEGLGEVLYPTVRWDPQEEAFVPVRGDPLKVALNRQDYIAVPGGIEDATLVSKWISRYIGEERHREGSSSREDLKTGATLVDRPLYP
tara:strand:- start:454 stop:867 length:414 start_codon:yes stop_codon:yes gene_type:complete